MQFKKSPVIFNEEEHSYYLGDKRMLGITGLIHSILGLGVYPDANDHVKDYIIPRAGSRGTAVHHAIQTYDMLHIRQTQQIVTTRYGCKERENISYIDETWDVTSELDSYIRHLNGFKPLANELTVSDNVRYASQIDNVWQNEKTGGIWLVDTKTNNTALYPLCGYFNDSFFPDGVTALKEYLSWQLSIYAELFEAENPELKVEGLACNWLRRDESAFWVIERKPTGLVKELLTTEYFFSDSGPVYFHSNPQMFMQGSQFPARIAADAMQISPKVVDYMTGLLKTIKETESKLDEAKTALRAAMTQYGVRKHDFGSFTATLSADSTVSRFDSKRFKEAHPDLYKQFTTQAITRGALTIKLKSDD